MKEAVVVAQLALTGRICTPVSLQQRHAAYAGAASVPPSLIFTRFHGCLPELCCDEYTCMHDDKSAVLLRESARGIQRRRNEGDLCCLDKEEEEALLDSPKYKYQDIRRPE
ncbi:hypothetical protein Purlil1_2115 [Purpureocillium lilacinum]|uniref:Uncharacterized protein n=1 Tax=Purpureocillium lilacinum TaxID=33203 RepID=A0ABR0CCZ2_PURLI|nr:hypothetical protein Purlil1_2115 [Purpureocillium lilacinum]